MEVLLFLDLLVDSIINLSNSIKTPFFTCQHDFRRRQIIRLSKRGFLHLFKLQSLVVAEVLNRVSLGTSHIIMLIGHAIAQVILI